MARIILISAMAQNRIIGTPEGMPWSVPEEYQQYLSFVKGNPIIMGRRSYEIFGPDLPGEELIVVSRTMQATAGIQVCRTLEDALELGNKLAQHGQLFVAGGGAIYKEALPLADSMYLSTIHGDFTGTVYFPEFDPANWTIEEEREEARFTFRRYERMYGGPSTSLGAVYFGG